MESAFELPVHISYRPPGWLIFALTFTHTGAIICVFTVPVPVWLKGILILAIIISYSWYAFRYLACRKMRPPLLLIWNINDEWKLVDDAGVRDVRLLPGAVVHPAILVLRFEDGKQVHLFILTPWEVDKDILRRLRVRLLYKIQVWSKE